jgi:hypothetical protein
MSRKKSGISAGKGTMIRKRTKGSEQWQQDHELLEDGVINHLHLLLFLISDPGIKQEVEIFAPP